MRIYLGENKKIIKLPPVTDNVNTTKSVTGGNFIDHTEITEVRGNTIVWNQLVPDAKRNGSKSLNSYHYFDIISIPIVDYHRYVVTVRFDYDDLPYSIKIVGSKSDGVTTEELTKQVENDKEYFIFNISGYHADGKLYIRIAYDSSADHTVGHSWYDAQLFDLTLMFGSGNEPETCEEFRSMFPEDYYSYDSSTIKHFTGLTNGFSVLSYFSEGMKNIGTVHDSLTSTEKTQRISNTLVLNGTEIWNQYSYQTFWLGFGSPSISSLIGSGNNRQLYRILGTPGISIKEPSTAGQQVTGSDNIQLWFGVGGSGFYLAWTPGAASVPSNWINSDGTTNASTFKAWLAQNPITVQYVLSSPIVTDITADLVYSGTAESLSTSSQFDADVKYHMGKLKIRLPE